MTTHEPSSQAGLATFQNITVPRRRRCPNCGGTLAYGRYSNDDPWQYCTEPECDHEI